jgi:hypothetical protein
MSVDDGVCYGIETERGKSGSRDEGLLIIHALGPLKTIQFRSASMMRSLRGVNIGTCTQANTHPGTDSQDNIEPAGGAPAGSLLVSGCY